MACKIALVLMSAVLFSGCSEAMGPVSDQELQLISRALNPPQQSSGLAHDSVAPVSRMIAGLESRLTRTPDDLKGWTLLAQSYAFTGQMHDAQAAGDRAIELGANADEVHQKILEAHSGATR